MSLSEKSDAKRYLRNSEIEINLKPSAEQSFFEKVAVHMDQIQFELPEPEEEIIL
ncbi:hypothetical protein Lnau_2546 [Legionella nautarum]|uniref:Uncharacterized protein n=1 Tax=Legionella nautarum TaxID=45070 RepID=A0A0W0WKN5_9GAMM|nr:hypothetical protein [Legionella nautarum]KTD32898.1 hypothetical protein Lnau_2546 [Legionella nautarum]